jgi:hypothetical protein
MKVLRPEIAELGEKFKRTNEEAKRYTAKLELIRWLVVFLFT